MSEVQPQPPEVQVKLNTFSLPVAVMLFNGKDKPDGLGLAPFPGYMIMPGRVDSLYMVDPTETAFPHQPVDQYIGYMRGFNATLPYRYWADRLALTAAWVIEHSGLHRPIKVQSAIVFRETRAAGPVWRVAPDGEYLSIQGVHGPRWVTCTRWRISDGSEVNDHGAPLLNQTMRLPTLCQVGADTTPEVALLNALDAAGFVKVAVEGGAS